LKSLVHYFLRLNYFLAVQGFCLSLIFSTQETFALEGQVLPKKWEKISKLMIIIVIFVVATICVTNIVSRKIVQKKGGEITQNYAILKRV